VRNPKLRETVEDISFGLLSTTINLCLGLVSFSSTVSSSGKSHKAIWQAVEQSSKDTGISKESLKYAFWKAKNLGLLRRKRARSRYSWELTGEGARRLESKLPQYQKERPWDGKLYLVTYDIPEKKRYHRNKLRVFLMTIGARQFQQSVYLILWDPTEVLRHFIQVHDLNGLVIVSDTGTNGAIGDADLDTLIWNVFRLKDLNERYGSFLKQAEQPKQEKSHLTFHYLSILKDDPQLPFHLLGPTWMGNRAYRRYLELKTKP